MFFLSFCPQAWLPCQPVHLFFSKFVFSGQLKWCTEGNSFSSPYITSFLPYLYFPLSQRSSGCRSNKLTKKIIVFPFSQFSWSLWLLGCKLKKKIKSNSIIFLSSINTFLTTWSRFFMITWISRFFCDSSVFWATENFYVPSPTPPKG